MKKIILRLLSCLIVLALIAALTVFVIIPLFSEEEVTNLAEPVIHYYEGGKKALVMENDHLTFSMDPTTTQFTVTDKASGEIWRSNPEDAAKDKLANAANKETLQATAIISYATSNGAVDFNNYKYSIANGNYAINQNDDGSISVEYSVGKIEKIYCIPTAITKERYDVFVAAMKKSTQKKLSSNYTLYEPSKLDSKKNKDEIIAMYPSVTEQALYILKSNTSENNKAKIEGYFAEGGYTQEDFEIDQQLVAQKADNSGAVFNLTMNYRLDGQDLVVEIPYDKIRYKSTGVITNVAVLPMFGAAGVEDEGFMFVPEGGGALINFNNGKLLQNSYFANLYGWDYATNRTEMINETRNTFPVFGMAKNGKSFLCFMEGATSYASIQADIAMRYNSYNWMCAKYRVLHYDQYNVSAKTAQLVYMYEKEIPQDTVIQRYRFFNTDSYVDMANAYGDYLRETYPALAASTPSKTAPVAVELIGAIDKTVVRFGLPLDTVFSTTTFAQAQEIIQDLTDKGVTNMNVRFAGWANGGVTQQVMTRVDVLSELGGKKAMKALIAKAKELNVPLYFDGVTCFAYDSGILEGFTPFSDAARYTTREQVLLTPFDMVTHLESEWLDTYYLVRPEFAKETAANMLKALDDLDAYGVSFRDVGSFLSGDYNPKDTVTREQVKAMNIKTLEDAKANGQAVMIRIGNDYAVPYADIITDMDLLGGNYAITDAVIPFYQIALHGAKDYTGESINLAGNFLQEFLTCVEYGAGLNFTFMAEDARLLQNTTHSTYFGSTYADWAEKASGLITRYQKDMEGLNQQRIVSHEKLTDEVAVTGYEDGTKVYVNYGMDVYAADGVVIPARDYIVERGQ